MARPRVVVLADDLIWATRLVDHVRTAGGDPVPCRALDVLEREVAASDAVVVDLTARAYDGVAAIETAARAGRRVLAVGQHDDIELRRRALAAGAQRVYAYRKLFESGPATLRRWLEA